MIFLPGRKYKYIRIAFAAVLILAVAAGGFVFMLNVVFPFKYKEHIFKYSKEFNVDPCLVFAVIKAESGFNPQARSKKDAKGLMQITDDTGQWILKTLGEKEFRPEILFEPETNIMAGVWYISWLNAEFDNDLNLVISAYNCGHGRVKEWLRDANISKSGKSLDRIPFPETEGFTKKVMQYYRIYRGIYTVKEFFLPLPIPA